MVGAGVLRNIFFELSFLLSTHFAYKLYIPNEPGSIT